MFSADKAGPAPQIRVGRITLSGGAVFFTDRFIKPNYTANLTDLSGRIGAIKAGTRTEVALRGKVDRTGPLDISGAMDPLGKPMSLDIKAKATGIEMSGFSPYSGRYVGYAIEKGKLSVDVRYSVEGGGKRFRPAVILAAAQACGGSRAAALDTACALGLSTILTSGQAASAPEARLHLQSLNCYVIRDALLSGAACRT